MNGKKSKSVWQLNACTDESKMCGIKGCDQPAAVMFCTVRIEPDQPEEIVGKVNYECRKHWDQLALVSADTLRAYGPVYRDRLL